MLVLFVLLVAVVKQLGITMESSTTVVFRRLFLLRCEVVAELESEFVSELVCSSGVAVMFVSVRVAKGVGETIDGMVGRRRRRSEDDELVAQHDRHSAASSTIVSIASMLEW